MVRAFPGLAGIRELGRLRGWGAGERESDVTRAETLGGGAPGFGPAGARDGGAIDIERRRDQLRATVAELQWDLGGLVYEMAIRERIRVEVIVEHAARLQDADAELGEVERILALEQTATAGLCSGCGAPHSSGAAFCWQCGQRILRQVDTASIFGADAS